MTKYETDKKTGDVNKLVKKAYYNPKITEKEGKIPSNTGQATTIALNSVENKIFNVSGLVKKKKDSDAKTSDTDTTFLYHFWLKQVLK